MTLLVDGEPITQSRGISIDIKSIRNWREFALQWIQLQNCSRNLSFFQSWTWVGCLHEERYDNPFSILATNDGILVGLSVLNMRDGCLSLTESGDEVRNSPFIEHNSPLLAYGAGLEVEAKLVRSAWKVPGVRRLVLSGTPDHLAELAGGVTWRRQSRPAPWVDLRVAGPGGEDYLAKLSANTRHQIRRSIRRYSTAGALHLRRATTIEEASGFLDAMIAFHTATWQARGRPGAFATPFVRRFHAALVARALPRGELDLLRISAGPKVIGYLYNFRMNGRIYAYQSGFDRSPSEPQDKPGLVCHYLAIDRALSEGATSYDFMAGEARYKRSMANAATDLVWTELVPRWSAPGMVVQFRSALGRAMQVLVR